MARKLRVACVISIHVILDGTRCRAPPAVVHWISTVLLRQRVRVVCYCEVKELLRLATAFIERGTLATYHDALSFWQSAARGGYSPPPELRALFARGGPAGATGTLALPLDVVPPPARRCGAIPYGSNERFVGREADLRVVAAMLRSPGAVAALCGTGCAAACWRRTLPAPRAQDRQEQSQDYL